MPILYFHRQPVRSNRGRLLLADRSRSKDSIGLGHNCVRTRVPSASETQLRDNEPKMPPKSENSTSVVLAFRMEERWRNAIAPINVASHFFMPPSSSSLLL